MSYQAKKIDDLENLITTKTAGLRDVERASSTYNPPTSCIDLQTLKYNLNGYYTVKNVEKKTLDTVYCNFDVNPAQTTQTWIGTIDVKTKQVQFSVKRNTHFNSTNGSIIPFQNEILNIGNAMNLSTGIFTAPVNGTYYFAFSALKMDVATPSVFVVLQKNRVPVASTYSKNVNGNLELNALGTQIFLSLSAGDTVNLYLSYGTLYDSKNLDDAYTVFSGWLQTQYLAVL